MSVKEYSLNFTKLSRYAPEMVTEPMTQMSKFVSNVSKLVVKECRNFILVGDMDIPRLMAHAHKLRKKR